MSLRQVRRLLAGRSRSPRRAHGRSGWRSSTLHDAGMLKFDIAALEAVADGRRSGLALLPPAVNVHQAPRNWLCPTPRHVGLPAPERPVENTRRVTRIGRPNATSTRYRRCRRPSPLEDFDASEAHVNGV